MKKNKVKKAILHWYSGDFGTLKELIDNGYYFSINTSMLKSSKGQNIIRSIPNERILIESDGPFSKINSQKFNPSKLKDVYLQINEVLQNPEFDKLIWQNFKALIT